MEEYKSRKTFRQFPLNMVEISYSGSCREWIRHLFQNQLNFQGKNFIITVTYWVKREGTFLGLWTKWILKFKIRTAQIIFWLTTSIFHHKSLNTYSTNCTCWVLLAAASSVDSLMVEISGLCTRVVASSLASQFVPIDGIPESPAFTSERDESAPAN